MEGGISIEIKVLGSKTHNGIKLIKNIRKINSDINIDVKEIYEPHGCEYCHQGYAGRIAIHEVLLINQEIRDAIIRNADKPELRKLVYKSGTITMLQDGLAKVVSGETTFEEILKLIDLEDDLGTNTNLGLEETIKDSEINNKARDYEILDL